MRRGAGIAAVLRPMQMSGTARGLPAPAGSDHPHCSLTCQAILDSFGQLLYLLGRTLDSDSRAGAAAPAMEQESLAFMANVQHIRSKPVAHALACAILSASIMGSSATARAAEEVEADPALKAGSVNVELNRLDPAENNCKASLVITNESGIEFESLALDLVVFDNDGIIAGRMAVELGPLAGTKTSVRAFSLGGMECDSVGRMLLNSVVSCETGEGKRSDCLGLIQTSSRADAPFIE